MHPRCLNHMHAPLTVPSLCPHLISCACSAVWPRFRCVVIGRYAKLDQAGLKAKANTKANTETNAVANADAEANPEANAETSAKFGNEAEARAEEADVKAITEVNAEATVAAAATEAKNEAEANAGAEADTGADAGAAAKAFGAEAAGAEAGVVVSACTGGGVAVGTGAGALAVAGAGARDGAIVGACAGALAIAGAERLLSWPLLCLRVGFMSTTSMWSPSKGDETLTSHLTINWSLKKPMCSKETGGGGALEGQRKARGLRSVAVVCRGRVADCRIKSKSIEKTRPVSLGQRPRLFERRFWEG